MKSKSLQTLSVLIFLVALLCASCGATENKLPANLDDHYKGMSDSGPSTLYSSEGMIVQPFDLSNDNIADLWKLYTKEQVNIDDAKETIKLVRKEVDTNFDGKVDIWFHYNLLEELFKEEADSNFDGSIDLVSYYDKGRIVKRDVFATGLLTPIATRHFREGVLYKVELDKNRDGLIERWEIYVEGKLAQIGHDSSGDGKLDYWESFD